MPNKIFVILLSIFLISCGGSESEEPKFKLAVLADNYAWGEQHSGLYVTNDGELFSFENNSDLANYDGITTDEAFNESYFNNLIGDDPVLLEKIDSQLFIELKKKIQNVETDNITEEESRCNDAGKIFFLAFTFNSNDGTYTPILLETRGDWAQVNNSQSAKELSLWLESKIREYQLSILLECKF